MPAWRLLVLSVVVLSSAVASFAADDPPADAQPATPDAKASAKINREWLAKDLEVTDRVAKALPKQPTKFADLYTALRHAGSDPKPPVGRDIGFGATWQKLQFHGGHVTLELYLIVFDGKIAQLRATYLGLTPERWKLLRPELLSHWPAGVRDSADGPSWTYFDQPTFDAFESNVHKALGARDDRKVPPALAGDYALLTDPLNDLRFGTQCGDGGDKPEARAAIERLKAAGGMDLLGNVLRGDNPVGRIYAAEALLAMRGIADLSERDKATIAAIKKLEIPISTCSGCEISDQRASALLAERTNPSAK